jgi:arylsulfatase A-like enzyme
MRGILRQAGLLCLSLLVILASMAAWLYFGLEPDTKGLDPSTFKDPNKDRAPVSRFVEVIDEAAVRPNVVLILADDLGYGDLGVQGSRAIDTPHIDRIAAEGVRLTDFYAAASTCSPSRAGLLTGRYPARSGISTPLQAVGDTFARRLTHRAAIIMAKLGVVDMIGGQNLVQGLPPAEITLPEALKLAGYRTAAFGKWHLGDFTELPEYHPFEHGFDHFVGFNMSNDDFPVAFWRGGEEVVEDIGAEQSHYTRLFTEEAVRFIEAARDGPFFVYMAHKDPHLPFFPSEPFAGQSDGGPYGDAVEEFDWSTGEILAALERLGIADQTLVIVTSDNGPWFEGSAGDLRGRKGQSFDGGFRVPLVARWPGRIPAGTVAGTPAMGIDLFPTLLGLAGLGLPSDRVIDGTDIWPLLAGDAEQLSERPLYFFHEFDVEGMRVGDWKYFRDLSHWTWPLPLDKRDNFAGRIAGARDYTPPGTEIRIPTLGTWPKLFQVRRDRGEAYDVVKKYPKKAEEMGARLEAWRKTFYKNPRGWNEE